MTPEAFWLAYREQPGLSNIKYLIQLAGGQITFTVFGPHFQRIEAGAEAIGHAKSEHFGRNR